MQCTGSQRVPCASIGSYKESLLISLPEEVYAQICLHLGVVVF